MFWPIRVGAKQERALAGRFRPGATPSVRRSARSARRHGSRLTGPPGLGAGVLQGIDPFPFRRQPLDREEGGRIALEAARIERARQDGEPHEAPANPAEVLSQVEAYVAATGARIAFGGESAFYRPLTDTIHMPDRTRFVGSATSSATECLYSTLLHELTHWTGVKTRCDREFGKRFGDDAYAMEELVAELGAAFLCADLGIANTPRPDHAAYISHWLTVLKADKKAIFTAASKASQAVDYLDALQPAEKARETDELEEAA